LENFSSDMVETNITDLVKINKTETVLLTYKEKNLHKYFLTGVNNNRVE